jgi:hypothetical protein
MGRRTKRIVLPDNIKVTIHTPAEVLYFSRGFYQVEEDSLYVPIFPGGRFFSYLDSPQLTLDVDRKGQLLFIQVHMPRRSWTRRKDLKPPSGAEPADIRLLNFRNSLPNSRLDTSADRSILRISFFEETSSGKGGTKRSNEIYQVAEDLVFEVTPEKELASIWITSIKHDRAAKGMAAWRKRLKKEYQANPPRSRYVRIEVDR